MSKSFIDWYIKNGLALDAETDEHWITTKEGHRVLLDDEGNIQKGFGGKFNGQKITSVGTKRNEIKTLEDAKKKKEEITKKLASYNEKMMKFVMEKGKPPTEEMIEEGKRLDEESEAIQEKLEELDPNSQKNVTERYKSEGFPTPQELVDSLPKNWAQRFDYDNELNNGKMLLSQLANWSGEGYSQMKNEDMINKAIKESSAKWSKGELFRGMSLTDEEVAQLKSGAGIDMKGLSSWSSDIMQAMDFAHTNENPVLLIDKTKGTRNALPIAQACLRPYEKEVIYTSNQGFNVKSVYEKEIEVEKQGEKKKRKVTVVEVETK